MLAISREPTNIPISISLLHEQEYNNLRLLFKMPDKQNKRRAFSEKNSNKPNKVKHTHSPKLTHIKPLLDQPSLSSFSLI